MGIQDDIVTGIGVMLAAAAVVTIIVSLPLWGPLWLIGFLTNKVTNYFKV